MCPPAALAVASFVATVVGTGLSFMGQMQQNRAIQARSAYDAAVARDNAILAERQAKDAEKRGKIEADRKRLQTRQLIGRQRTQLASAGVIVDEGTALDITQDTAAAGELDARTIQNNAEREALGFRTQGMNFAASAELAHLRGQTSSLAGVGTLLGGLGGALGSAATFRKRGFV